MQLVVVMAVRKAVRAATITFTPISIMRFFIRYLLSRLIVITILAATAVVAASVFTTTRVASVLGAAVVIRGIR